MSEAEGWDEFDLIDRLFRPLTEGAPEALGLIDDAALIAPRRGHELVVTTDTIVEGVHFLRDDPPGEVARKLLRVNLSDLAAKGASPYGYFLNICWPPHAGRAMQEAFAAGLARDQAAFGVKLFGGDTTATPGPLTLAATMLGWVPAGAMVTRAGARAGDLLQVSGTIGDGWLGLTAARGGVSDLDKADNAYLIDRYRLPKPRLDLQSVIAQAHACADVSDGLVADAGHIAAASGLAASIDLEHLPLSAAAGRWLAGQGDAAMALAQLAGGGDDYELVCAAPAPLPGFMVVGRFEAGSGVQVRYDGRPTEVARAGFRHGKDG